MQADAIAWFDSFRFDNAIVLGKQGSNINIREKKTNMKQHIDWINRLRM